MSTTAIELPDHITINFAADRIAWDLVDQYRKTVPIHAIRMSGPFTVETSEGELRCEDGYLCRDSRGYPYPVHVTEFDNIYEPLPANDVDVVDEEEPTVVETLQQLQSALATYRSEEWGDPRELSIAITHLEDAQMRFTRARAKATGAFRPVDLQRVEAVAERARFEAEIAKRTAPGAVIPVSTFPPSDDELVQAQQDAEAKIAQAPSAEALEGRQGPLGRLLGRG